MVCAAQAGQGGTSGASTARYSCNLVLTVYPGRQIRLATEDITRLTRDDMVLLWKVLPGAAAALPHAFAQPHRMPRLMGHFGACQPSVVAGSCAHPALPSMVPTCTACGAGVHGRAGQAAARRAVRRAARLRRAAAAAHQRGGALPYQFPARTVPVDMVVQVLLTQHPLPLSGCLCCAQTALLLCVADACPAMFKSLAAAKLEALPCTHGDSSLALWTAVTVRICTPLLPLLGPPWCVGGWRNMVSAACILSQQLRADMMGSS